MPIRMLDQTKAFPKKVNFDQYKPIVEAALNASNGDDGLPRVVASDWPTYKEATRATNALRNHIKANNLQLVVSCPEQGQTVFCYKGKARGRSKKKKNAVPPPPADGNGSQPAKD
jgi:hypothetical protein